MLLLTWLSHVTMIRDTLCLSVLVSLPLWYFLTSALVVDTQSVRSKESIHNQAQQRNAAYSHSSSCTSWYPDGQAASARGLEIDWASDNESGFAKYLPPSHRLRP